MTKNSTAPVHLVLLVIAVLLGVTRPTAALTDDRPACCCRCLDPVLDARLDTMPAAQVVALFRAHVGRCSADSIEGAVGLRRPALNSTAVASARGTSDVNKTRRANTPAGHPAMALQKSVTIPVDQATSWTGTEVKPHPESMSSVLSLDRVDSASSRLSVPTNRLMGMLSTRARDRRKIVDDGAAWRFSAAEREPPFFSRDLEWFAAELKAERFKLHQEDATAGTARSLQFENSRFAAAADDVSDETLATLQAIFQPLCNWSAGCGCFHNGTVSRPVCGTSWARCDSVSPGVLVGLDLAYCGLRGILSDSIGSLHNLTSLYLEYNQLTGAIPASIGDLSQLQHLYLFRNQFNGSIPASLGRLRNLRTIVSSYNQLTGVLPNTLCALGDLIWLAFNQNQLSGSLPDCVGNLTHLQLLFLTNNRIGGSIPSSIGNATQLVAIDLGQNRLEGPIPDALSSLFRLFYLSLDDNLLTASVPQRLCQLARLQSLDLSNNALEGSLEFLNDCTHLRFLNLAQNRFNGTFSPTAPPWATSSLRALMMYSNQLQGSLPAWLFAMPSLEVLFLSSNNFSGMLPAIAVNTSAGTALEEIDLSDCQLEGPIPPSLAQLQRLAYLSLSRNRLTGTIPHELGALVFIPPPADYATLDFPIQGGSPGPLRSLLLANNQLVGTLPSELLAPVYHYEITGYGLRCIGIGSSSLSVLDVSHNRLEGALQANSFFARDTCGLVNYAPRQLVQLLVAGNQFSGQLPVDLLYPPMSVLDVSNNRFTGQLPLPVPGFSTLQSLNLAGNQFRGAIPDNYGLLAGLSSLSLQDNGAVTVQNCSDVLLASWVNASRCLPPFLTVDPNVTQSAGDGLLCRTIAARRDSLTVQLDQATYLQGAQCFCNTTSFQVPRATPAWVGAPVCADCRPAEGWCQCSGSEYAMTGCWPLLLNETLRADRSGWLALECPYIASPRVTACQLPFSAVCGRNETACGCAAGYQNRRCTECAVGYFSSARSCRECAPVLQPLLPVVWALVLIAYSAYLLLVPGSASGVLKVLTFYGQSLLLLAQNARVPWPPGLQQLLQTSSSTGSLSATAVECVVPGITTVGRYFVYTFTPLLLLLLCFVVYLVGRWRRWAPAYDVLVYMSLSMLLTTYFSVTLKALAGVSCTLPDRYLNMYPWISCDPTVSAEFRPIAALSISCLLVYTLGVPAVAGYHLFRKRELLHEPHIARRLGFLFGSYRRGCFWWEYVVIARRVLLAMAITLVPFTEQQLEAAIVMAVLVVSVALQHGFAPFSTQLENRLELVSLYALLLAFLGVYVSETSAENSGTSLAWLPVLVIVLVTVVAVVLVVFTTLVLLVRLLPRAAETRVGFRLMSHSMLGELALKSQELQTKLLEPAEHELRERL